MKYLRKHPNLPFQTYTQAEHKVYNEELKKHFSV